MSATLITFYILSTLIVGLALLSVLATNLVRAALALAFSFFMISGIFWILGSPFVAVLQLVVNAGAIPIVTIFIVMMTRSRYSRGTTPKALWALVLCVPLALAALNFLPTSSTNSSTNNQLVSSEAQQITPLSVEQLGIELLSIRGRTVTESNGESYTTVTGSILAFEATAIVLLVAFVGAIILAKHEPTLPNYSKAEIARIKGEEELDDGALGNGESSNGKSGNGEFGDA